MELKIDKTKNIAHIKLTGPLNSKEILKAFDGVVTDKNYKKGMGRLWDFRKADLSSLTTDTVKQMAQYSLNFPPGINDVKVAFVTSRPLEYGLSRMFEMASRAKTPISVFDNIDDAKKWMTEEKSESPSLSGPA
jgi:hypothetical protein